ncbi:protein NRT1/ PTR FAMILY 5.10-like isoform X1 [Chenopodium quinoa]|uniref:protein NRT1/ PTR FAMILY 5.10-like isoform X1 n=1 Tax=Chenopodium quinoa TaxID=63459 RepID=UPI000B77DB20|nr:protein NRT1/ PTR FAMILY 5.10-like isoform X1 [Chenopodium quinoa]
MATSAELLPYTPLLTAEQPQQPPHEATVPGIVDYKHRPAVRSKHGRWLSASFIIWVEMTERIACFGISGNLINFLTQKLGQSTAMAASNVSAWVGVSFLLTIFGAVVADSFLGKYYTIVASSLIYILGLGLLTLSAMLPSFECLNQERSIKGAACSSHLQIVMFFVALYLVGVGQGGHKPCVQAFGADQFDGEDPRERKAKSSFFNWWYFGVCMGAFLGTGVLSYIQDNLSWGLGFGIPCILVVIAQLIFLLGTMNYRYTMKSEGENPFKRIGRVFVAAARNWNASPTVAGDNEEAQETKLHDESRQFMFLRKALLRPEISNTSVKACSMSEVEEAKAVLRLFPIWATILVYAMVIVQPGTLFTKQGMTLDRSIGSNFFIPAAALQCAVYICVFICIPIYDRVLVPVARRLTGKPAGISMLQRVGTGLFISIFSMVVAAVTEKKRLKTALQHGLIDRPDVTIPMSIWWLLPQYVVFGIAEVFTMIGLQEFFYDQVPNELRSVGLSLYLSIFGVGGLLSSFLIYVINKTSSRSGGESWFSDNLNHAHLDYFYWLLAGLSALGLALFVYFAKSYIYNENKTRL